MKKHNRFLLLVSLLCITILCGCGGKNVKVDGMESSPTIGQPTETVTQVPEKQNMEVEIQNKDEGKPTIELNKQDTEIHNQMQEDIKSIYSEMKERGITKITQDGSTSDLFLCLWRIFSYHYWYGEDYINRFQNRDTFCNDYQELQISFIDNVYWLGQADVVGGEGFYVEGFEISKTKDCFDIIGNNGAITDSTMVLGQLEFGNSNEVKIDFLDMTYIPMDTDMRKCINNELFLGNWYDDKKTCYSFGSDYKLIHDGLVENYEPYCYILNGDYNFIEIFDTDGKTIKNMYGYTMADDLLSFYETMEVDNVSVLRPEPFLVLTRKR